LANTQNLKPFQKGDPRINRLGRPRKSDLIAELAKSLLEEPVETGHESQTITRLESILREWLESGSFQKKLAVIQYAYGKIPLESDSEDRDVQIVVNWGNSVDAYEEYLPSTTTTIDLDAD